MIVPADDVGDTHVVIIDDDGEHVSRGPIGAEQDEIVQLRILDRNPALNLVFDDRLALARRLQPDNERFVALRFGHIAPRAVDPERLAHRLGLLALFRQLLLGHVTAIGRATLEKPMGNLGVPRPELRLVIFVAIPIEPEPAHAIKDRVDSLGSGASPVGILNTQQELAAVVTGIKPVEQRRARAADVQVSGG